MSDRGLQLQMGHATIATTQRYIKFAEQHREKGYDALLPKSLATAAG